MSIRCFFFGHCWEEWEKTVCNGRWFGSIRRCQICDKEEKKEGTWSQEEIAQYEKEREEWVKKYFEDQKKRKQELDENVVLDRRGERICSNSRVWYEGKECWISDFHAYSGELLLIPCTTAYCNVGWGYTTSTNGVVVLK